MVVRENPAQIPFEWAFRPALDRENFLIAPSNQDAVGWIDRWPDWPAPICILYGPASSGKSHLAAVWQKRVNALPLSTESLLRQNNQKSGLRGQNCYVLDGVDPWIGDNDYETALFHLYNMMKQDGGFALMTMRQSPSHCDYALPDLASRLKSCPAVRIQEADDALLSMILMKLFADRQLSVSEDVIQYLLPRMERSFEAVGEIVALADKTALIEKRAISVPLMRKVLSALQATKQSDLFAS